MEIQFKARNAKISEEFKGVVSQKLIRMERFGVLLERVQVEISHESNPRHGKGSHKVQLTTHGAGPLVRAEAASLDDVSAFDLAVEKFELQIRKAHERRKDFGHKTIRTSEVSTALVESTDVSQILSETAYTLVREKEHKAEILEISSAIDQMELLDHNFYLFIEKESATPAVVYRRKGYAYGLIRLQGN
jgi:ribosomal subunit interface protein